MPDINPVTLVFNGLDAVSSQDKVPEDEVMGCNNIDFSMVRGAAAVRRGSVRFVELGNDQVEHIWRNYNNVTIGNSPWYAADEGGDIWRITGGFGSPSATIINSDGNTDNNNLSAFTSYQDKAFIVSGSASFKDDGTDTTDWILQAPAGKVTLTTSTLTPLSVVSTYTLVEGTGTATTGETFVGTATVTTDVDSLRSELRQAVIATNTNLNLNGTNTIGRFGVHYIEFSFDEPKYVTKIHVDYSMDDSTFSNYMHFEFDARQLEEANPDAETISDYTIVGVSSIDNDVVDEEVKANVIKVHRSRGASFRVAGSAKDTFGAISIPVTAFRPVVQDGIANLENAQACRIIIDCWGPVVTQVRNWVIQGGETYPLTDSNQGLAYWETFATMGTNEGVEAVFDESAPSPVSDRKRIINGRMLVVSTNTATGTQHGITHRRFYRQGGFINAPYCVGSATYTAGTHTFTDTLNDIDVLIANQKMVSGIRATMPTAVRAVSEPFFDRIFIAWENYIGWSLPGQPGTFPKNSTAKVSYDGDRVQALHVWNNTLIIVTRDNVYEMTGNIFEGLNSDWFVRKSSARRGSRAPRATIKTPYGIMLLQDDGIAIYQPGDGIDVPLDWAMEKIGDIFKGPGDFDPASFKGDRVVGMNNGAIDTCIAAYKDGFIWLGYPANDGLRPNKYLILDMRTKRTWVYDYLNFSGRSIFADRDSNAMLIGTDDGTIMRLEQGNEDADTKEVTVVGTDTTTNPNTPVEWDVRTRQWTASNDTVIQNVFIEAVPSAGIQCHGIYDGTNTTTLASLSGSTRDWYNPPLNGSYANSVRFVLFGSQTGTAGGAIYNLQWNAMAEPRRVNFYKTEHFDNDWPNNKEWEVLYSDIETVTGTGNVLAVAYVDNTAVMTHTIPSPSGGRIIAEKSFPVTGTDAEPTVGELLYVTYTSTDPVEFKLWGVQFQATNQPAKQDIEVTEPEAGEERIMDALDVEVDPGASGTLVSTVFVDCDPVGTYTSTGTCRQSFTHSLPPETYGRTIHAVHTGTAFTHWKTWFHTRLEPDRWKEFNTDRESGDEAWFHYFNCDINPLGNTVTAVPTVDGSAVTTYTFTGSNRQSFTRSFPNDIYGRTIYTIYSAGASGRFKHFFTWYDKVPEPDRALSAQFKITYESPRYLKTLVPELDPISGTVTAVVSADGTAIGTYTFTGNGRQQFNQSLELNSLAIRTATSVIEVDYSASSVFKHYQTRIEAEAKPFGKTQWTVNYRKIGGATRVDLARFWSLDAEVVSGGTATLTTIWTADGIETQTNTITFSGRHFRDMVPFGPGFRGYLFENKVISNVPVHIWASRIDLQQVGPKSVSIRQIQGTPQD